MKRYKRKFEKNDIKNAKKDLVNSLKNKNLVRETGQPDIITIATGGTFSVVVQILGYDK